MHKQFANALYSSKVWKDTRKAYAKSVSLLCEKCLARGLYTPGTEVHHIIHLTPDNVDNPEIALSFDNLMLLCKSCHDEEHRSELQKRYNTDGDGHVLL